MVYHKVVQWSPLQNTRTFSSSQKGNAIPIGTHPPPAFSSTHCSLLIYCLALWICLFGTFHKSRIIYYVAFRAWLLLLSIMFSRSIQVVAWICTSFLFMLKIFHCIVILILLVHSSGDEYLFLFFGFYELCYEYLCTSFFYGHKFLVILDIYLGLEFSGYMVVSMFNFLRNYQTLFQSGCPFCFPTSNIWRFKFFHILTKAYHYPSFFVCGVRKES